MRAIVIGLTLVTLLGLFAPASEANPGAFFITPTWGRLTSGVGWRPNPFRRTVWQHHWGIDIAAPYGTPVLASASGTVQFVGLFAGYGRMIYIDHGGGWTTLYAHLSRSHVSVGHRVKQRQVIGAVGSNGRSTGPHLHFEIRFNDQPVDPLKYLGR